MEYSKIILNKYHGDLLFVEITIYRRKINIITAQFVDVSCAESNLKSKSRMQNLLNMNVFTDIIGNRIIGLFFICLYVQLPTGSLSLGIPVLLQAITL